MGVVISQHKGYFTDVVLLFMHNFCYSIAIVFSLN